jgi:uncharacterized protein (DUF1330 family)
VTRQEAARSLQSALARPVSHRNTGETTVDESRSKAQRYYQVVFVSVRDPVKFARYVELVAPIVGRYAGGLERMLSPEQVSVATVTKPDTINIVFYDSHAAFSEFSRDADFQRIVHLRSESIAMATIAGFPVGGELVPGRLPDRVYAVELARFASGGAAGYREYEEQSEPLLQRHGHHVERVLAPREVSGFPFMPDIVKVAYFDALDGMQRLHRDPSHQRIERELYPRAVAESVWVFGKVHPFNLESDV